MTSPRFSRFLIELIGLGETQKCCDSTFLFLINYSKALRLSAWGFCQSPGCERGRKWLLSLRHLNPRKVTLTLAGIGAGKALEHGTLLEPSEVGLVGSSPAGS